MIFTIEYQREWKKRKTNMNIILYGSRYGTAQRYAKELSKRTNINAVSFENDLSKIENPEKLLKSNYLRYQIVRNGEPLPIQNLNLDGTLLVSTVNAHSQDVYELRVWLDKNVGNEAQDKEFYGFVSIHTIFSE